MAATTKGNVLPIFILDDQNAAQFNRGAASRCWLHHALQSLNNDLKGQLRVYAGDPINILTMLVEQHKVSALYWNRCYEPWRIARDKKIKDKFQKQGLDVKSFNGSLLWEPWQILKKDKTPYKVFTPFFKKGCLAAEPPRTPAAKPKKLNFIAAKNQTSIAKLNLCPTIRWDKKIIEHWQISEQSAHDLLSQFLKDGLSNYKKGRDFPALHHTSRLSPYLHFGLLSPNQIWYAAKNQGENDDIDHFCAELGWREFSNNLLYHFPNLPEQNLQSKFDAFPWLLDETSLRKWQRGQTGYPIIDAGMRQLWQTGYMHNRVRMIVASFLVKNLNIHWRYGAEWFWDCLVDADLASNSASWQWVAGSGADAAPFFRIFNPITQSEKFDPNGDYIHAFVPELNKLKGKHLYAPYEAPENILAECGIELGVTYPYPIVDLKRSREIALAAYSNLK